MIFFWLGEGGVHFRFQFSLFKENPNRPPPTAPPTPSFSHPPVEEGTLANEFATPPCPPPVRLLLCLPGLGNIHFYGQS